MNILETERLILRPWRPSDAGALYTLASDPEVGPPAGWEPHPSEEFSLLVINEVFSAPHTYAVVPKGSDTPVGCCGIVPPYARANVRTGGTDAEIGYWMGKPFWGRGYIPEAVEALTEYCFRVLGKDTAWINLNATNSKSRRVAEKCGYFLHHSESPEGIEELFFAKRKDGLSIRCAEAVSQEYMPLLLLGDESDEMIRKYIGHCMLYAGLIDGKAMAVCAVLAEEEGPVEIKNLAVSPEHQRKGIGRAMLRYIEDNYPGRRLILGTGETPSTLRFYRSCGFTPYSRIENFFTDNYDHPIVEEGVVLRDMIYLSKGPNK